MITGTVIATGTTAAIATITDTITAARRIEFRGTSAIDPPLAGWQGPQRELALFSMSMDSTAPDSAPADMLNRAIWHSVKGFDVPYNYGEPIKRIGVPWVSPPKPAGF
jgi:hypothetical protein